MQLHEILDKLTRDVDHLDWQFGESGLTEDEARVALVIAKRVRRNSNLLVRAIAQHLDQLQRPGGRTSE